MLAQAVLATGADDLTFVKLTGVVLGVLIMYWAIRRLFGGGKPKR